MAQRASLPHVDPTVEAALIAVVGTVVVAVTGFWATRSVTGSTLAEQRTRTLNERFATAADQIGSDEPAVRLAGVYAMAGLADDWKENRQTCVDVLCGYLRMPYQPDPGDKAHEQKRLAFRASREVRHTAIRVIAAHLKDGAAVSWQGLNFDFTGVVFDGGSFGDANFSGGKVDFSGAEFADGRVDFVGAKFSGSTVSFNLAKFCGGEVGFGAATFSGGHVWFNRAEFSGSQVDFSRAKFSGSQVDFSSAHFSGGEVSFWSAQFSGREVNFFGAQFSGGEVSFGYAEISGGLRFNRAVFSRGKVDFGGANFSGGYVGFSGAEFSGSQVGFSRAEFRGSQVDFVGDASPAKFTDGAVDFSGAAVWSHTPTFPWTAPSLRGTTPPPSVKLPKMDEQSQE